MSNLKECGNCGYPLDEHERSLLIEVDGKMWMPAICGKTPMDIAKWEVGIEDFEDKVAQEKEKLKNKRSLRERLFPYKLVKI